MTVHDISAGAQPASLDPAANLRWCLERIGKSQGVVLDGLRLHESLGGLAEGHALPELALVMHRMGCRPPIRLAHPDRARLPLLAHVADVDWAVVVTHKPSVLPIVDRLIVVKAGHGHLHQPRFADRGDARGPGRLLPRARAGEGVRVPRRRPDADAARADCHGGDQGERALDAQLHHQAGAQDAGQFAGRAVMGRVSKTLALLDAVLAMAACGGGGNDDPSCAPRQQSQEGTAATPDSPCSEHSV